QETIAAVFAEFPDDWEILRQQRLAYFSYRLTAQGARQAQAAPLRGPIEALISAGLVAADPITYEDFLPVSAAGIFQSNLGDETGQSVLLRPNQAAFERDLGAAVADPFAIYAAMQAQSLEALGVDDPA